MPDSNPATRSWRAEGFRRPSSDSSRDFPDPGGPETAAAAGISSALAFEQTLSSRPSSTCRPTNLVLLMRGPVGYRGFVLLAKPSDGYDAAGHWLATARGPEKRRTPAWCSPAWC